MKKYIETIKIMFKSQMAYRFDIFISMVFSVSKIILAYVLWGAIFSTKDEVAGFTFNGMISYYIISSFIAQLNQSSSAGWQISAEIRQGLFSKYMVRPMNIFGYFTAHTAGTVLFLLIFNLAAAVLWTFLFGVKITLAGSFYDILLSVVLILLGLLFMMQLNYYIGILAFKFLDIGPFMMIRTISSSLWQAPYPAGSVVRQNSSGDEIPSVLLCLLFAHNASVGQKRAGL